MENASKALLIAGAMLVVIAIIALGMNILGQGENITNQVGGQMDAVLIERHNAKFASYVGPSKTVAQVTEFVNKVNSSNVANKNTKAYLVTLTQNGSAAATGAMIAGGTTGNYLFNPPSATSKFTITVAATSNGVNTKYNIQTME